MSNKKTKFYPIKISDIKKETDDCVSIGLNIDEEIQELFSFIPGQYLTFKTNIKGEEIRRSYSICSGIDDPITRVAVKKMPFGKFSTFACDELKADDIIEVMPPMGRFTPTSNTYTGTHYCGFAGGSGITPIISIIKSSLQNSHDSHFTLFNINKSSNDIIFKEDIEQLKNKYLDRFSVHHIFTREKLDNENFNGRIDGEKIRLFSSYLFTPKNIDQYFICGPEPMILSINDALIEIGVDKSDIKFELFSSPDDHKKIELKDDFTHQGDSSIRVWVDGEATDFKLNFKSESILDAAMEHGADLPYSCKGGVCCTCKAKMIKGTAHMDINYSLEPDEIEAGYILTCQAHPTSEEVELSFEG